MHASVPVRLPLVAGVSLVALLVPATTLGGPGPTPLLDVFPPSVAEAPAGQRGQATITTDYAPGGSSWAEGLDERDVFLAELAHRQDPDDSFTLRVGKGGQIYSLRGAFGESVPPSCTGGRRSESPWNDEVWQFVAVCTKYHRAETVGGANALPDEVRRRFEKSPFASKFFVHGSGVYIPDAAEVRNLYCPLLAFDADVDGRTIRTLNWGLVPQVRTMHRSPLLYYCQVRDIGAGIIELTWAAHNFSTRDDVVFDYLNAPWGGTRRTSLPEHAIADPEGRLRPRTDFFTAKAPDGAVDVRKTGGWNLSSVTDAADSPALALVFGRDRHLDEEGQKAGRDEAFCQLAPSHLRDWTAAARSYETIWKDWQTRPENTFRNYDVAVVIPKLRLKPQTMIWYRSFLVVNRRERAGALARGLVDKVDYGLLSFDPADTPLVPVHVRDGRVVEPAAANGPPTFELYARPVPGTLPLFLLEDVATGREVVTTDPYWFVPQEPLDLGVPAGHPHHDYYAAARGIALDRHTGRWKRLLGFAPREKPAMGRFVTLTAAVGDSLVPPADPHNVDVWVRADESRIAQRPSDAGTAPPRPASRPVAEPAAAPDGPRSVEELWADFDPRRDPLETEVIREWREDGGVFRHVRFLVGTFKGTPARMAAIYGFPDKTDGTLPAVMHIHGGGQRGSLAEVKFLVSRGYAALSVNWGGRGGGDGPFNAVDGARPEDPNTDWGAVDPSQRNVQGYATMLPGPLQFYEDREHPKNNNWYLLALGCRRGLTFLEQQPEVDPARLGVHGYSMGGNLTMYVAGTDDRVKAAVPAVGGAGWRWEPHVMIDGTAPPQDRVSGDVDVFRRTLSFESYAPHIRCPVMHRSATNDFHGRMDDVYRTNALIHGQPLRYSWVPHCNHRLTPEVAVAMPLWLDHHLKGGPALPETPVADLVLRTEAGLPRLRVKPDGRWPVERCEIYYSVDPDPRARFWRSAEVVRDGDVYVADLPLESVERPLFAFANVSHTLPEPVSLAVLRLGNDPVKQFCLSSELRAARPAELAAAGVQPRPVGGRVIEDFANGWRDWYRIGAESPVHWQNWTRKVTDPAWRGPEGAELAVTLRTQKPNTVVVSVVENEWRGERGRRRAFICAREVPGGDEPHVIRLSPADFVPAKEQDGSLATWAQLDVLGICGHHPDERPARTPAWNGPPPEILRVEWLLP